MLGCAFALIAATPGLSKDATDTALASHGAPAQGALRGLPGKGAPPSINRKGGTAIINFVAPVTAKTMASLAENAQNAVISGADAIRINISSQGGSVHAMQFGVNVLKSLSVPIETVAMSQIASAAVALYCAGDKRYMADGSGLYLHQQRGYHEIQDKTAAAVVREYELNNRWYDGLLHACTNEDAERDILDYSARDVVVDLDQATALGMVTSPMTDLGKAKIWGLVMNVTAPDSPHGGGGYPSYR